MGGCSRYIDPGAEIATTDCLTPNCAVQDQAQYQALWPGQSGKPVLEIVPVKGISIRPSRKASNDMSAFVMEDQSRWTARSSGAGTVWLDFMYSDEQMDALHSMFPSVSFPEAAIASGQPIVTGAPVFCMHDPQSGQPFYFTDLESADRLEEAGWQNAEVV